jgi:hypothetical protein
MDKPLIPGKRLPQICANIGGKPSLDRTATNIETCDSYSNKNLVINDIGRIEGLPFCYVPPHSRPGRAAAHLSFPQSFPQREQASSA